MTLPEVGQAGQARLRAASVLVVGAGGLGCAVLQYLAAAGVGRLVVVDHDRVEEGNLHRQPLYRVSDCGRLKVAAAHAALHALNPDVTVEAVPERLTPANVCALVQRAHIIVDAADSFAVTYTLSDACTDAGRPLVSASVIGLASYVGVFGGSAPSYRAVFPDMPAQAASCSTAGVLGTAVGVMGTLQAHLVLSLILGLEAGAAGRLVSIDFRSLRVGGFSFASAREPAERVPLFIAPSEVSAEDFTVDLRSVEEAPAPAFPSSVRSNVDAIGELAGRVEPTQRVVLCCRSGMRAWRASQTLRSKGIARVALIAMGD